MPSLEIAAAQPAFQNHLGTLRAQTPVYGNVISSPFAFGNDKKLSSDWKLSHISIKLNFNLGRINVPKGSLRIKAVATLESKSLVQNENAHAGYNGSQLGRESSPRAGQLEPSSDDSEELDDREKLRRLRISNANEGSTLWNKGRKHSPETLKLIRERTRLAMQNPKVKMKLVNLGHAQRWKKQREKLLLREHCCYDWQNLIAEASRQGYDGEEELRWDIYKILDEKLTEEYTERVEQRKLCKEGRFHKQSLQNGTILIIATVFALPWLNIMTHHMDPKECQRRRQVVVQSPREGYLQRKRLVRKTVSLVAPAKKQVSEKNSFSSGEIKIQKQRLRLRSKAPMYKDPLVSSKLEMIKNIRAQRAAPETGKTEAVERARLFAGYSSVVF